MPLFSAWLNPLRCTYIEPDFEKAANPSADQLLDYLFTPELYTAKRVRGCGEFVARYREIDAIREQLVLAPMEDNLLQKLIWPLRHAKGSYSLGNYIGCIALCGMVGEMTAILLWDISKVSLQQKPLDDAAQRLLLGRTFERLTQDRRTQVLRVLDLIGNEEKVAFDSLRGIRNKYLHVFSHPHGEVNTDAKQAFRNALAVVTFVLGQSIDPILGGVTLRPELMKYLEERGILGTQPEKQK
jgi:hypothetical protein